MDRDNKLPVHLQVRATSSGSGGGGVLAAPLRRLFLQRAREFMTLRAAVIEMGVSNGAAVCTNDLCEPIRRCTPLLLPPPPPPPSVFSIPLLTSPAASPHLSLPPARLFCQLSLLVPFPRP